jgi:hypothetical protein
VWGFDDSERAVLVDATAHLPELGAVVARAQPRAELGSLWLVQATMRELDDMYSLVEALMVEPAAVMSFPRRPSLALALDAAPPECSASPCARCRVQAGGGATLSPPAAAFVQPPRPGFHFQCIVHAAPASRASPALPVYMLPPAIAPVSSESAATACALLCQASASSFCLPVIWPLA